jgi:hypothetical protein
VYFYNRMTSYGHSIYSQVSVFVLVNVKTYFIILVILGTVLLFVSAFLFTFLFFNSCAFCIDI